MATVTKASSVESEILQQLFEQKAQQRAERAPEEALKETLERAAPPPEYGEGYHKFSEVFGFKAPSGRDHAVCVFKDEDWDESVRGYIPELDEGYVPPKRELEAFVVGLMRKHRMLLTGPKGSGKSILPEQVAARLRIPWIRLNFRLDMDSSPIFGAVVVREGSLEWMPGPAEELGRFGGILQCDEVSAGPAGINLAMQWMYEKAGRARVFLADKPGTARDKMIVPHEWFIPVATDNTRLQGDVTGQYAGTQPQNSALLDRITTTIPVDYMTPSEETAVLKKRVPGLPEPVIRNLVSFAGLIRRGYTQGQLMNPLSLRGLLDTADACLYWGDVKQALSLTYLNKLEDVDRKHAEAHLEKVFGK